MEVLEEFKKRQRTRTTVSFIAIGLMGGGQWLKWEDGYLFFEGLTLPIIGLGLQAIALYFIYLILKLSKCPVCEKNAGNGWVVTVCQNCGQKFT